MQTNQRSILFLRPEELTDVISMKEAIDLIELGYKEASEFPIVNAPRSRVHSRSNVRLSCFPGGIDSLGVIGSLVRAEPIKVDANNQSFVHREHPIYILWDSLTGELLSIMAGAIPDRRVGLWSTTSLMGLRTGATSGVGFRYLARKDASIAGLYGTGGQAFHKLLALQNERKIQTYKVFSRDKAKREKFCRDAAKYVDAELIPVDNPRDVMKNVDVVICATNSNVPVFDGNWIEPGQHIVTVVGSNSALVRGGWLESGRRENDDVTVQRADVIVTNWRDSVVQEQQAGLIEPLEKGIITWDKIVELGEVISGSGRGRKNDQEITYHANNNGTAAADLAIAKWVYDRCVELGRGTHLPLSRVGD